MGEGEAAEESRDAEVLALVCNLNYRGLCITQLVPRLNCSQTVVESTIWRSVFLGLVELYNF